MSADDEIDPLQILQEDLLDESVEVQLEAVRNLPIIALTLGVEQTKSKLVNLLETYCFPVEVETVRSAETYSNIKSLGAKEEVLREIALVLNGDMIPHFGGAENVLPMLLLLQKLAMVEETVIREAAVQSLLSCAEKMNPQLVDSQIHPLVTFLSEAEWWTSRVSAASAGPRLFPLLKSDKSKDQMSDMIQRLTKDEMPMVRQEAYCSIPNMLQALGSDNIVGLVSFIVPVLKNLSKELQENMRHRIVDIVKVLLQLNKPQVMECCKEFLNIVINDGNWRVRKRFLDKLIELANAAGPDFLNDHILPGFCRRLGDAEPTVRVKAIQLLPEFLGYKHTNHNKVKELITLDIIRTLVNDEFPEVREATSGSLLSLFENRGELPDAVKEELFEFLKLFQADESGEVRLNFCKGITKAYNILGDDLFVTKMLPLIIKLQEDTKWRVRCGVIENIAVLTKLTKSEKEHHFTKTRLLEMLLGPFKDPVCAVRNKAIEQIPNLVEKMGHQWVLEKAFNVVIRDLFQPKSKYLLRIVPIRIGEEIALHLNQPKGKEKLSDAAVDMMCKGCLDAISNVRLVSAQALIHYMEKCTWNTYKIEIQKALEPLAKDSDEDVKFFGVQALAMANQKS